MNTSHSSSCQTECFTGYLLFQDLGERKVVPDFSGGQLSSDGGALLLRQVDSGLGVTHTLGGGCFVERRDPELIDHSVQDLFAQRIYALALGDEDITPHARLPGRSEKQVLLDILDDATRTNTGARLYPAETLLAHFDFLSRVLLAHGLPLALYVDYHSFFFTHSPDSFTQLGQALDLRAVSSRTSGSSMVGT